MNIDCRKLKGLVALPLLAIGFAALAQDAPDKDVFKGKLFPPNVILEHRDELELTRDQYTGIRQAVVATQSEIAEHEWDLREAYQSVLAALDEAPADKARILGFVDAALTAENAVKKQQVALLVDIRNLLTDDQVSQLKELTGY